MGTNYDLKVKACSNACEHCSQEQMLHIGKSMTMFQAYLDSPFGPILNFYDWRKILEREDSIVVDEYGNEKPGADFVHECLKTLPHYRSRQYNTIRSDYFEANQFPGAEYDDFIDVYGFSFTFQEFS